MPALILCCLLRRRALNSRSTHCDGQKVNPGFSARLSRTSRISPLNPYAFYILLFQRVNQLLDIHLDGVFQLKKQISEFDYRNINFAADWPIEFPLHLSTEDISQIKNHDGNSR